MPRATRRATTLAPRTRVRFRASLLISPPSLPRRGRPSGRSRFEGGRLARAAPRRKPRLRTTETRSSCLRGPWLVAGFRDALERRSLELLVVEHARDADLLADVACQVQPVPLVQDLDGLRALLQEARLPAAPLRRILAGRVFQPERLIVLHETSDDRDRFGGLRGCVCSRLGRRRLGRRDRRRLLRLRD